MWTSTIVTRMHPLVRRNPPLLGQLDHANRRLVTACTAGPAPERRLQLPDRRVMRPADRVQGHARPHLASTAFDLQPAVTAVQALANRRTRLRWSAIALHADRPFASARSAARAAFLASWRAASARTFAPMIRPPQITSRVLVLIASDYSGSYALAQSTTPSCSSGLYRFSLVKRFAALPATVN